jgi:branched-chain amino acid transport system permease protein
VRLRYAGPGTVILLALIGFGLPAVLVSDFYLSLAVDAVVLGLYAVAIGFLVRQCGLVSFGHGGFFGGGAYLVTIALSSWNLQPAASVLAAVAGATLLAGLIGMLIVRVPGVSFAMLTLALSQGIYVLTTKARGFTGGFDGIPLRFPGTLLGHSRGELADAATFWPYAWGALVLALVLLALVSRSHFGRLLVAIRENEERARFCGYGTYWPRVGAFALSGGVAGLAGVLFALHRDFVSPELLYWTASGNSLVMALLGGTALLAGPVVGAAVFVFGRDAVSTVTERWQMLIGLALIVVIVFSPEGLTGAARLAAARVATALRRRKPSPS